MHRLKMLCGLHGGTFAQLVTLRQFRPAAAVTCSAQGGDHTFQVTVEDLSAKGKVRLDAYLASKLPHASRARLQASIKEGLVSVNGKSQAKASYAIRSGDAVACSVLPPPPLEANPEAIPLDIVYEDEHLLVINKAADMVMHPSPGHYSGTLVNALLHHCGLQPVRLNTAAPALLSLQPSSPAKSQQHRLESLAAVSSPQGDRMDGADPLHSQEGQANGATAGRDAREGVEGQSQDEDDYGDDDEDDYSARPARLEFASPASGAAATIRPGIVHRLDKGTTGLLVVAKDDATQLSLASQFKDRTVQRQYWAITLGIPSPPNGRVAANVGRDLRDRKKMAACGYASARGRTAASNYAVLRVLADGGAGLVQWQLETGRTHQIRVHAKHIGHPLLADDTYGGGAAAAVSAVTARRTYGAASQRAERSAAMHRLVEGLGRPALHAKTLGFVHPVTREFLQFDSELPPDFSRVLQALSEPPFAADGGTSSGMPT